MTQNGLSTEKLSELLKSIDPSKIADRSARQIIEILLNVIEQQQAEIKKLREENQNLRDENNRLKGEQGKPKIKGNTSKGFKKDHSSEVYLSTCATEFLKLVIFHLLELLFPKSLPPILLVNRGFLNDSFPRNFEGIRIG